ncbi:uncharacterized protein LOC112568613 [Pomacea canaliculata]|uniref:uncharacterized protein LOC112568613 n=1 Tax=Pomacea canaliculata TaxID=400727 RepID=UPI000D72EA28|nr:uncharacterized protein LOC112568613 [Pomacea canaliculata]
MLEHYFSDDPFPRVKISKWKCARIIFCGQEQTTSDTSINQLMSSQLTNYQTMSTSQLGSGQPSSSPGMDPQASNTRNIEDIDGEGDSSDVAHLHVDEREADVTRNQTVEAPLDMFVSKKSDNEAPRVYLWILGTIALFYGLPAVAAV